MPQHKGRGRLGECVRIWMMKEEMKKKGKVMMKMKVMMEVMNMGEVGIKRKGVKL